jgi:hypothetical protein
MAKKEQQRMTSGVPVDSLEEQPAEALAVDAEGTSKEEEAPAPMSTIIGRVHAVLTGSPMSVLATAIESGMKEGSLYDAQLLLEKMRLLQRIGERAVAIALQEYVARANSGA